MSELAVRTDGLSKRFGRRSVVNDLDLRVPRGAVTGFLGPNGAGKTTTLRMLLGLVRPTAGSGTVLGEPLTCPARYLPRIGALVEAPACYPGLSGRANLSLQAHVGGIDHGRVDAVLDRVGLAGRGDDPYREYSLGMKQRLGIAAALLGGPELLILDEPTNGLDPAGIRSMRELLRSLAGDGSGILLSSHLLPEVQHLADWIVVVDRGRQVFQGPAADLTSATELSLRCADPADLAELAALAGPRARRDGLAVRLPVDGAQADRDAAAVNRAAAARAITLVEISTASSALEDRYIDLLSKEAS